MRIVISAGDPSGDVRASELIRQLSTMTTLSVSGLGGRNLREAGADTVFDLDSYSVMGFAEVLSSMGSILRLRRDMRSHILETDPEVLLLVDYPGFNIPLAQWAKKRGIRVIYYISPQLWAWGSGRVRKIGSSVDLMITLFKFEVDFYRERGVNARWAGHPLADAIPAPLECAPGDRIALLPGSRVQEVSRLLPEMAGAFGILRDRGVASDAVIAVSPGVPRELYAPFLEDRNTEGAGSVAEALEGTAAALVCSGTATLETAMWGVPFVIAYRTSPLTYLLARLLVRGVSSIGMANLVARTPFAEELIQGGATPGALASAVEPLLREGEARDAVMEGTRSVREALGPGGSSRRAAEMIMESAGS